MTEIHSFAEIDASLRSIDTGEPATAKRRLFASAARFQNRAVKPREWLVEGFIPNGTVTLLGGDGGSGKSLLAMMLCKAQRYTLAAKMTSMKCTGAWQTSQMPTSYNSQT